MLENLLYDSRAPYLKFGSLMSWHENSNLNLIIQFIDNEDGTFPKKINADHRRTLQAICACSQICNWSTWCLEIPPNC